MDVQPPYHMLHNVQDSWVMSVGPKCTAPAHGDVCFDEGLDMFFVFTDRSWRRMTGVCTQNSFVPV